MKKVLLSFLSLVVAATAFAQTPMYFVTGTPIGTNYIPIGGAFSPGAGWENNRSQLLYLPGEFGSTVPAGLITKIYFRPAVSVTATYTNFRIDMGQSNITSLTLAWETGLTTVLPTVPSQSLTAVTNQWMGIQLVNPLPFDPTKNLIVDTRQTNTVPMSAIGLNNFTPTAGNRRTWTSNPTFNSASPAPGGTDNLVEYDFGFDLLVSCDSPINFVKNVTRFTADISWDPRPGATEYEYLIDQSPLTPSSSGYAFTNTPSVSLKNLPDGTCYYIHVRTICGTAMTSGWSLDSFCTIKDCYIPQPNIDIANITSTTAIATWDPVPGATGYEYSVGTTPDTPTNGHKTSYTSVKLQGLWPNKPLYFFVKAYCSPTPASPWGTTPFHTMAHTGVENINGDNASVEIFPNPVKNIMSLKVYGGRAKNALVVVTDITGRVVHTQDITADETDINVSHLAPGTYYVKYSDDDHKELLKVTKQ